jgi:hypothetical protein
MSVLAGVLVILGLLFSLVAIVGVIAPSVFKNRQTGEVPKRLKLLLGGTVASFISLAIAGGLMPQSEAPEMAKVESTAPAVQLATGPAQATAQPAEQPAPEVTPAQEASQETLALATQQMVALDKAMKDGVTVLKTGDLQALGAHSRYFNQLVENGYARFGSTIFEPLGRCGTAGNYARTWWQAQLSAAQNKGVELTPGAIQSALDEYQSNRTECLKSADPVVAAKEDAELKEKFGGGRECLTVFTVDPETKEVVAKPKPEHCQ